MSGREWENERRLAALIEMRGSMHDAAILPWHSIISLHARDAVHAPKRPPKLTALAPPSAVSTTALAASLVLSATVLAAKDAASVACACVAVGWRAPPRQLSGRGEKKRDQCCACACASLRAAAWTRRRGIPAGGRTTCPRSAKPLPTVAVASFADFLSASICCWLGAAGREGTVWCVSERAAGGGTCRVDKRRALHLRELGGSR